MNLAVLGLVTALLLPTLLAVLDMFAGLQARHTKLLTAGGTRYEFFNVLVPIWGSIKYLENVEYLSPYGGRVILCTTMNESNEFNRDIDALAARCGFQVYRARIAAMVSTPGARATSGTLRDRIIRDAHELVTAPWVVCIDADTVTERPLSELVGAMIERDLDFASVRLVPSNGDHGFLAHIQAHEYHVAMLQRRIMPWLVSGACHAARGTVHREVMTKHSLFFQGNDVEVGLLAHQLGYKVGHVPFDVPTTVPETWKPWLRQRLAWAGGEVRLFIANPQLAVKHPFWWAYGALITIAGFPLRWDLLLHPSWPLLAVPVIYTALQLYLHRGHWDPYLLILPFYAAFSSLVLTPCGIYQYAKMAITHHNLGLIRARRKYVGNNTVGVARHGRGAASEARVLVDQVG